MPTFLAVRCFACGTFQSIQRTKQSKWACKLCHEKQSFQRAYAMSDAAKDVRYAVQELNYMRGEAEQQLQAFEREWQGNAGHCLQGQNCAHSVDLGERWEVLDEANSQHCLRQEREVHDDQHFPANISAKAQEAQQDAHASTRFQSTSVRGNLNGIERPLSRWAKYTPLSHHPIDDNIGVASLYEPTEARMWHNPDQFGMPVSFSSADDGGHEVIRLEPNPILFDEDNVGGSTKRRRTDVQGGTRKGLAHGDKRFHKSSINGEQFWELRRYK